MKKLPLVFLLAGFVFLFLSVDLTFTSAAIGTKMRITHNLLLILGLVFFTASLILSVANKSLESLVVPAGTSDEDKKRIKTAMRNYFHSKGHTPYVLITGEIHRDKRGRPKKDAQHYLIYKKLREDYGLKPSDFIIEGKSKDTLGNFLYSIKKLKRKKINHVKIATNRTHYWRFKLFEKEAKKEGIIDPSFEVEPIYTPETPGEFIYGVLAYVKDYFRVKLAGSLEKAKNKRNGPFGDFLKKRLSST